MGLNTTLTAISVMCFVPVLYKNEIMLYRNQNVKITQVLMYKDHKLKWIYIDGILDHSKWRDGKDLQSNSYTLH